MKLILFIFIVFNIYARTASDSLQNYSTWTNTAENNELDIRDEIINDTEACVLDAVDSVIEFSKPKYPVPPGENCTVFKWVEIVEGYNVDITFDYLELNGGAGDYLIISPGTTLLEDESSIILTGNLQIKKKFRIMEHSEIFVMLVTQERTNISDESYKGFKLTFKPYGDLTTTLPTPSPVPSLPTDPAHANHEITIYLKCRKSDCTLKSNDKSKDSFWDYIGQFKSAITIMAKSYCDDEGIKFETPPESRNVILNRMTECPISWPNWDTCMKVQMNVAVYLIEDNTYELTHNHLQAMWERYSEEELKSTNLQEYTAPDSEATLLLWLYITLGVVIIFSLIMVISWRFDFFSNRKKCANKPYDQFGKVSTASTDSWMSSIYQDFPPMTDLPYDDSPDKTSTQDIPTPTSTLIAPEIEQEKPRPSEQFGAAILFRNRIPHLAFENPSFDISSEQSTIKANIGEDFIFNTETSIEEKSSNQNTSIKGQKQDRDINHDNESAL